jgi:hypothetical protein
MNIETPSPRALAAGRAKVAPLKGFLTSLVPSASAGRKAMKYPGIPWIMGNCPEGGRSAVAALIKK